MARASEPIFKDDLDHRRFLETLGEPRDKTYLAGLRA
jgi:hypothetical protein